MGPESGIVDGESPSISLSYIDKTVYKRTHTGAYSVSTESMCHQLGSCLVARYLSSTLPLKRAALQLSGVGWGGAMLPPIAGRLVMPPAKLLSVDDERCVVALSGKGQGKGLQIWGKGGGREEGGEWTLVGTSTLLLLPVTGDPFPHSRGVLGQALGGTVTHGVALGTALLASGSSGGTSMCLHRTTGGGAGASRWGCGGGGRWGGAGGVGLPGLGAVASVVSPLSSEFSDGSVQESKEQPKESSYPVERYREGLSRLLDAIVLGVLLEGSLEVAPGIVCSDGETVWGRDGRHGCSGGVGVIDYVENNG